NQIESLSQIGDIPANAESMTVLADGEAGPPVVKINGAVIPMIYLSGIHGNGHAATFGGDISAFAGNSAELRFESLASFDARTFDDIRFSTTPIPEVSTAISSVITILFFNYRRATRGGFRDRSKQTL